MALVTDLKELFLWSSQYLLPICHNYPLNERERCFDEIAPWCCDWIWKTKNYIYIFFFNLSIVWPCLPCSIIESAVTFFIDFFYLKAMTIGGEGFSIFSHRREASSMQESFALDFRNLIFIQKIKERWKRRKKLRPGNFPPFYIYIYIYIS